MDKIKSNARLQAAFLARFDDRKPNETVPAFTLRHAVALLQDFVENHERAVAVDSAAAAAKASSQPLDL